MHPKEARKERVGTGRVSHLALKNSRIIVGEKFDEHSQVASILDDYQNICFLLYPGSTSTRVNQSVPESMLESHGALGKNIVVFVIDATWACAKSLMRESHILHSVPRISFELDQVQTSKFVIKQQPAKECLSTCESLYWLLHFLDIQKVENLALKEHENLLYLLDRMCVFQHECAANPELNRYRPGVFKEAHSKKESLKWKTRKIYFEEFK